MTEKGERIVILNLFQDLLKRPRVKGKRFRTKFGMTRTETVPKINVILNSFQDLLEGREVKEKDSELNSE